MARSNREKMREDITSVLAVRHYKKGYHTIKYVIDGSNYGCVDYEMTTAFTNNSLEYIGETKWAYRLTHKWGLSQLQSRKGRDPIEERSIYQEAKRLLLNDFLKDYSFSSPCSLGFNEEEQKWYGWSHRAIYGFGIGSTVELGHCSYKAHDKESFIKQYINFWSDSNHINVHSEEEEIVDGLKGVWIRWVYDDQTPNEKIRGTISGAFAHYPEVWGRGEWTAKTLEDAKQMASDFADGVS